MYYQELYELIKKTGAKEAIEELDRYLAFLPNTSDKIITSSNISTKLGLDISIIQIILQFLLEKKLFEKVYIALCPECGREIFRCGKEQLVSKVDEYNYCNKCNSYIEVTTEDIYIGYKLIKRPTISEDKIKEETKKLLGYNVTNEFNSDNLKESIHKKLENPNDFFYNPSNEEINELKCLLSNLNNDFDCTTEKGNSLEGLIYTLFKIPYGFNTTKKIRGTVNQFDCFVRNDNSIKSTVYEELGSSFIIEAKNEEKKPDNNYITKLYSILNNSKNNEEQKVGIIISKLPWTSTCYNLSREYFLNSKVIIFNITINELKHIIYEGANLLNLIQAKIQQVKNNIHTPCALKALHKLYKI